MAIRIIVFLVYLSFYFGLVLARNPGIHAQITKAGLNVANDVITDLMTTIVRELQITDHHGEIGSMLYSFTGMEVDTFSTLDHEIEVEKDKRVSWTGKKSDIYVSGNWQAGNELVSHSGTFKFQASDVSLSLAIDTNLQLLIEENGCCFSFENIDISYIGEQFDNDFPQAMKGVIAGLICDEVTNTINSAVESIFTNSTLIVRLFDNFYLDLRQEEDPVFKKSSVETFHNGEIFWESQTDDLPFVAPNVISLSGKNRMLSVGLSGFVMNSFLYRAHEQGILQFLLTANVLPSSAAFFFNTACDDNCIGYFLPVLHEDHPNSLIELNIESVDAPIVTITKKHVHIDATANISFYAVTDGQSPNYIFSLGFNYCQGYPRVSKYVIPTCADGVVNRKHTVDGEESFYPAEMTAEANVYVKTRENVFKANKLSIDVKVLESENTGVDIIDLQSKINEILTDIVIPELSDQGFAIPKIGNFEFEKSTVKLREGSVILDTDVSYEF